MPTDHRHPEWGVPTLAWLVAAFWLLFATPPTSAESASPGLSIGLTAPPEVGITIAQIESKIKEAEAATDLDEQTKAKLLEQLRRAQTGLETASAYEGKAADYAESLTAAPKETATIRAELANAEAKTPSPPPSNLSLAEIEQRLAQVQAEASLTETRLNEIDKTFAGRSTRLEGARVRISEVRRRLEEITADLKLPAIEGEAQALSQARRWAQQTAQQALWSEMRMLEQELASADVRAKRLQAMRDLAQTRLTQLRNHQRALEEVSNRMRRVEAEQAQAAAVAAESQAVGTDPHLQKLTRENARLAQSLTVLTDKLETLGNSAVVLRKQTERIQAEYQAARQRIEIAGINQTFGLLLLDRRAQLPDLHRIRQERAEREAALTESMLQQLRYQEERSQLRDLGAFIEQELADVAADPISRSDELRAHLAETATDRLDLIDQALGLEETYQRALTELNFAASELLDTAERYDTFLAEHLLWVRSANPLDLATLALLPSATAWLISPSGWSQVLAVLTHEVQTSVLLWLFLAGLAILMLTGRAVRHALRATAEPLRRVRTDGFRHTLKGLVLTLIDALPGPLLLAIIGWQLTASQQATPFTESTGGAALGLALGFYYLRAFRVLCITGGVANRHFRWTTETAARLRRELDWLIPVLLPLGFISIAVYNQSNADHIASLGRITLVLLLCAFALFLARVLHPTKGVVATSLAENADGLANRTRQLWYPAMVSVPLALAILALLGFAYTAGVLFDGLVKQLWLAFGLIILHQSIVRWLVVTRRQLALKAALERHAARRAEASRNLTDDDEGSNSLQYEEPEADLSALDEQTRKLINALVLLLAVGGLWLIWRDLLPALGVFDRITLWHYTAVIEQAEQIVPFTLADLGILVLTGFVAFAAARHLPALIEIVLLKQTVVSAGTRYAIKTLSGYTIFAAALLMISSSLGLSWSQAQWLVAALGVGIGFGLQEIVANFISGLIILFEQPIRVGDIVTVGDTTGVVTRIRIRATTIRNYDRQELLVPNKEFITGRLLNWTLTDQINRITINIGVAYGSDTDKARRLLAEIAAEHEEVLDDPAPIVSFEGFGDNCLSLLLRCYLGSLDNRLRIITELHQRINDRFNGAGIVIAFPQRDLHMFTSQPLDIRLHRSTTHGTSSA